MKKKSRFEKLKSKLLREKGNIITRAQTGNDLISRIEKIEALLKKNNIK